MTKKQYILNITRHKDVLDLGCMGNYGTGDKWLHRAIREEANSLIGVDLHRTDITGFDLRIGNAEELTSSLNLGNKRFDVIVAGDLIEHLFNPGMFLDGVNRLSTLDTDIVIITPNMRGIERILRDLFRKNERCRSDHTCWYSAKTLKQLVTMRGFKIVDLTYGRQSDKNTITSHIRDILGRMFPYYQESIFMTIRPL